MQLTPKRPLRSEKDKERRLSRPASIATPTASMKGFSAADTQSLSGADSSNRNSVDTTDSTSEEDLIPPPLPAKTRDSTDFTSLNYSLDWNSNSFSLGGGAKSPTGTITRTTSCTTTSSSTSIVNSSYEYVEAKNFIITQTSLDDRKRPPTPPPKPSRNSKYIP